MMKQLLKKDPTQHLRWALIIFAFVLVGGLFVGIRWATYARPPLPEAVRALESDNRVEVTKDPWLTFAPRQAPPTTGFIFYPGGRIDPRGYAPLMKTIAAEGYLVVVPEMPVNMAVFHPNIADDIIAYYPDIQKWVIGGHSVGGTMAAQYTSTHSETINGLTIWASYPANNADLSELDIPVISIYGSREHRVNETSVMERQHLLPADTHYIRIEGGDHHQFGSYKINPEDHLATTSRASQQEQITHSTLELLREISVVKVE